MFLRALVWLFAAALPALAATFGTVVARPQPLADLAVDEARRRLYVVNPALNQVEVYSTASNPPRLSGSVRTSSTPLAAALSRNGRSLYVICYAASSLDIVDLTSADFSTRSVSLPANPEALAVGFDERVLISTTGTGTGQSVLLTYDPGADSQNALRNIAIAPPAPLAPALPPPNGVMALASRARLEPSRDGRTIVGVHGVSTTTRNVFVFDAAASTVLRSRSLPGLSTVLAVSADGSRFLSGNTLLESGTMLVLGQQNTTNLPYALAAANFAAQATQGGAVFVTTALGSFLAAGYNIAAPVTGSRANGGQLLFNSTDSLLVRLGLQIPEAMSGKMAATQDSATIYAISQSGFLVLPLSTLPQLPVALPDATAALLSSDQCGALAQQSSATIAVRNVGGGRLNVSASVVSGTQTSATLRTAARTYGADVTATFTAAAGRSPGTATPDTVQLQSAEAINVIPTLRIYQNSRNTETRGAVVPLETGTGAAGLTDMLADAARRRLYIANPNLNRIEVFDTLRQELLAPIPVGQLPRSMALGSDGDTLYVANSGSEVISIVDLNRGAVTGRVDFPPVPFNAAFTVITPQIIASSERGPQVLMSDGTLWKITGNSVTPRVLNPNVFGSVRSIPAPQSMVATPDGAFVLVLAGNGTAYLYDAAADDFVNSRPVTSVAAGFFGPVAAGPQGGYYLVNDQVLNAALTAIGPSTGGASRPVAAVAASGAGSYARFSTAFRLNPTAAASDAGLVEVVDIGTGRTTVTVSALESPLGAALGAGRAVTVPGRTMVVDAAAASAYVLTVSGLSIVPLTPASTQNAPQVSPGGVVNTANGSTAIAPGGLITILGRDLASGSATAAVTPLPSIAGGVCVTLNNNPLPLLATSPGQINAQLPPALAPGRYPLVVRNIDGQSASAAVTVTVARYAPAVFLEAEGPAIFHQDGRRVDKTHPATRDEPLTIYATGLGVTTGGRVSAGVPAPSDPLAVTAPLKLFFGDPTWTQAAIIVDWSGLKPGSIGVYQINCRIPGFHINGDALPVTLRIGGVDSPRTGPAAAAVYVR
jgi:uncharacterized protein (TIGR03437 family)